MDLERLLIQCRSKLNSRVVLVPLAVAQCTGASASTGKTELQPTCSWTGQGLKPSGFRMAGRESWPLLTYTCRASQSFVHLWLYDIIYPSERMIFKILIFLKIMRSEMTPIDNVGIFFKIIINIIFLNKLKSNMVMQTNTTYHADQNKLLTL